MAKPKGKNDEGKVIGEWTIGSNESGREEVQPLETPTSDGLAEAHKIGTAYYEGDLVVGVPDPKGW